MISIKSDKQLLELDVSGVACEKLFRDLAKIALNADVEAVEEVKVYEMKNKEKRGSANMDAAEKTSASTPKKTTYSSADTQSKPNEEDDVDFAAALEKSYPNKNNKGNRVGVSGALFVKCDHCGQEHGFWKNEPMTEYRCRDCGKKTPLDVNTMRTLRMHCECGTVIVYKTNIAVDMTDIPCRDCGAPVPVFWHEKHKEYLPFGYNA